MKFNKAFQVLSATSLIILMFSPPSWGESLKLAHIASPEAYELLLENEEVIVIRMVLKPGQADKLHRHNNETVYFEKGGKLKISEHQGESFEAEIPDGHVMWHKAWAHQVTNVGTSEVIAIIVEDKP
ncbi:MAG: hypothetical protein MI867_21400 [Pseudomonadales bacterium]|nr:hypothetical protein [Pseudomonadales bacterium]